MPNALSETASTRISTTRAAQEPDTSRPNNGPPSVNSSSSWTTVTRTSGTTLPTMMSSGAGRRRPEPVPCAPAVVTEECEPGVPDTEGREGDGHRRHSELRAARRRVALRPQGGGEQLLHDRDHEQRHQYHEGDRRRVAQHHPELVPHDHPTSGHSFKFVGGPHDQARPSLRWSRSKEVNYDFPPPPCAARTRTTATLDELAVMTTSPR